MVKARYARKNQELKRFLANNQENMFDSERKAHFKRKESFVKEALRFSEILRRSVLESNELKITSEKHKLK